jgi:hypothetical protein
VAVAPRFTMSKTLFNLSEEILELESQLDAEDLTDEQRADLVDRWLEAQGDAATKLDNYAGLIQELDGRATIRRLEAIRLDTLAKADERQIARLKERLKLYFERHGLKRFETERFKLALQGNGGQSPLIIPEEWEDDPANAPEAFQRRVIQLDKAAIREAIRNDEESHGARLGERGSSIRIR